MVVDRKTKAGKTMASVADENQRSLIKEVPFKSRKALYKKKKKKITKQSNQFL